MDKKINLLPLKIMMFVFPFLFGGFHVFTSCILSAFLAIYLIYISKKRKGICFYINDSLLAVAVFVFGYAFSSIIAEDSGMAVLGFFKFLPILLMAFVLMQTEDEQKNELFSVIPIVGVCMTAVSFPLHLIEPLKELFTVAGRLSGFFQYSNSFALYLLLGLIICASKEKIKFFDCVIIAILLFGIFESGSRSTFAITALYILFAVFTAKNKLVKIALSGILSVGIISAVAFSFVTDNFSTVGRFLTTALNESTFLGRLLYYKDALPVILKHPFGLGYMGYYFSQTSFQTGVYSVMFVHNEVLQILLDVGWIPAILTVVAIFETLFSKNVQKERKIILFVCCVHSMLDFDLQFISVFIVALMCFDLKSGKEKTVKSLSLIKALAYSLIPLCVYFGIVDFSDYLGENEFSAKIYPLNTLSQIKYVEKCTDIESASAVSETILSHNKNVFIAYSTKAGYEFSKGNIGKFIEYENAALDLAPYNHEEYEIYAQRLLIAIEKYKISGDSDSIIICGKEIEKIIERLEKTEEKTSSFALKIKDKPNFEIPESIQNLINEENVK